MAQFRTDKLDLLVGQAVKEGQGYGSVRHALCYRKRAWTIAEHALIERLQVYGWKIVSGVDAALSQFHDELVAVIAGEFVSEPDDIHKPTDAAVRLIDTRRNDFRDRTQRRIVPGRHALASCNDLI